MGTKRLPSGYRQCFVAGHGKDVRNSVAFLSVENTKALALVVIKCYYCSMDDIHELNVEVGNIYKVISTENESRIVTAQQANGSIATITGLVGALPERGEIIFVSNNGWSVKPDNTWVSTDKTAVVREILKDKRVLIETNSSIDTISNPKNLSIKRGNTIEYNLISGIVSILNDKPIRLTLLRNEELDTSDDYLYEKSTEGFTFDNFGGYPQVVSRAKELIRNQLENRPYLDEMKVRPIRGILLTGPPGTGKTFLAKIIAQESKASFFLVNGPTIISKWLGETENTLRQIFDAAKKSENGAIIFFDEIDSIAADRSGDTHEASKKLVAQLLTLMDGFDENDGNVVVIAATNRASSLDPAIRRPGRFDWEIEFGAPTQQDRREILEKSVARHKAETNLPIADVVMLTDDWSAADLVLIIAEAGQIAAGDKRTSISAEDFAQGYERVAAKIKKYSGK